MSRHAQLRCVGSADLFHRCQTVLASLRVDHDSSVEMKREGLITRIHEPDQKSCLLRVFHPLAYDMTRGLWSR